MLYSFNLDFPSFLFVHHYWFVFVFFTAIPIPEKTKNGTDKQHGEPENLDIEDSKASQANPLESTHEEALEEVDVSDNKPNTEGLEASPSGACLEGDAEEVQKPPQTESIVKNNPGKRKLQIQGKWRGVDPVFFFKDEDIINSIKDFYGIDERFPFNGHLVTRNKDGGHVKRIYYVSKSVKDVLELNFSVGQQLKIASLGLKMFVSIFN